MMKFLSLLTAILIFALLGTASAGDEASLRLITVHGEGVVETEPDEATIRLGASASKSEVASAKAEAEAVMEKLLAALDELGISKQDIKSSRLYIYPQYRQKKGVRERVSYKVVRYARITLRDVDKLQALIDKSVEAGANLVEEIQLTSTKKKALEEEAMKMACEDARRRAEVLAGEFDAGLGNIHHLSDSEFFSSNEFFAGDDVFKDSGFDSFGFGEEPDASTYLPGQIKITSRIVAVFELEDARSTD